jgi:hypothetical protein
MKPKEAHEMTEAEKQRDAKIKQTAKKSHFVGGWEIEDP